MRIEVASQGTKNIQPSNPSCSPKALESARTFAVAPRGSATVISAAGHTQKNIGLDAAGNFQNYVNRMQSSNCFCNVQATAESSALFIF